jgi:hypothetical protein
MRGPTSRPGSGASLVLTLHGMHYTGYVFNDFARMLEIVRWITAQIGGDRVPAFLSSWDGRYSCTNRGSSIGIPRTLSLRVGQIPTLNVVDDTCSTYRTEMAAVIATAKALTGA